jgi:[ribosomal protein S5]-alanine N-acetyltransferase
MPVTVRVPHLEDAEVLAALAVANRDFLAPYEPERDADHYTTAGQRALLARTLAAHEAGTALPFLVLEHGEVVGRVTVNDVVRGPFLSGHLGYWVSEHVGGRGVATTAVGLVVAAALGPLGLHRVQAAVMPDNARSLAVLAHHRFERIGHAPRYLRIAGAWRDHVLLQRVADEPAGG